MKKNYERGNFAKDNFLNVVTGKRIVFLENDSHLEKNGGRALATLLTEKGIEFTILGNISDKGLAVAVEAILANDIIIFRTQWTREISLQIEEFALKMKDKKTFIEVYLREPRYYYHPGEEIAHNIYIISAPENEIQYWEFHKLTNKAIWEYENDFDQ